ncbi:MAG: IS3 family transposase [Mycobacteriales bacterium]
MPKEYPKEVRERAVRLVVDHRGEYDTEFQAIRSIGARCNVGSETLRRWVRHAEVDAGKRPGVSREESVEIRRLRRENVELRRANEILKAASGFLRGRARAATGTLVSFVNEHKKRFGGVEPICRVLKEHGVQIAPSTYYAAQARGASARALRDEYLREQIRRVFDDNYSVYGAYKIWRELQREGQQVARCTVRRLMKVESLHGAVRGGKKIRTTVTDPAGQRAPDLINRDFFAEAPNRCWVADFTYVPAWCGIVYVAFCMDLHSRAIVGWSASTNKRTKLVLDALDMGLWRRERTGNPYGGRLIHHSDAGSQYTSFRFTTHLIDAGLDASIGTVGDALDNALMESTIGLYKTELIKRRGPWRNLANVELATAEWVDWYNAKRLHTAIGDVPPTEYETLYYTTHQPQPMVGTTN